MKKKKHDPKHQQNVNDEPIILPFRVHTQEQPQPPPGNGLPVEPPGDKTEDDTIELFWAGRNHAMRRSARWAA
jgi:hypothetical protein